MPPNLLNLKNSSAESKTPIKSTATATPSSLSGPRNIHNNRRHTISQPKTPDGITRLTPNQISRLKPRGPPPISPYGILHTPTSSTRQQQQEQQNTPRVNPRGPPNSTSSGPTTISSATNDSIRRPPPRGPIPNGPPPSRTPRIQSPITSARNNNQFTNHHSSSNNNNSPPRTKHGPLSPSEWSTIYKNQFSPSIQTPTNHKNVNGRPKTPLSNQQQIRQATPYTSNNANNANIPTNIRELGPPPSTVKTYSTPFTRNKMKFFGKFILTIMSGKNLKAGQGIMGKANPYVRIKIGHKEVMTEVHTEGGKNPVSIICCIYHVYMLLGLYKEWELNEFCYIFASFLHNDNRNKYFFLRSGVIKTLNLILYPKKKWKLKF